MKQKSELQKKYEEQCELLYIFEKLEYSLSRFIVRGPSLARIIHRAASEQVKNIIEREVEKQDIELTGFQRPKRFKFLRRQKCNNKERREYVAKFKRRV